MSKKEAQQLAKQLLDHHVAMELEFMTGEQMLEDLQEDVALCFKAAETLRLRDIVEAGTINGIIHRHVVERDIPAIIPEMAAGFTNDIVSAPFHQQACPGDVVHRDHVEELVDQTLLLKEQRAQLIDQLLGQPLYRDLVANILYEGIGKYIYEENLISRKIPGVSSALRFSSKMLNKAVSGLDEVWEKSLKGYISRNVETMVRQSAQFLEQNLTDEELKTSIMEAWDTFSEKTLGDLQAGLGEVEWSEFVVIGYSFWLTFRETDHFRQCYETVVNSLFEQYGDYTLASLAEELNITQETVMTELAAVLPHSQASLKENGLMEQLLRRRLSRFYNSDSTLKILAG
ncbi:MAG: hypothetical protein EA349_01025 [Halomonadaceae bacterium]|nr:MAG: hypothetical protein EA349_01025 [Halomonadaceae bacterium]